MLFHSASELPGPSTIGVMDDSAGWMSVFVRMRSDSDSTLNTDESVSFSFQSAFGLSTVM